MLRGSSFNYFFLAKGDGDGEEYPTQVFNVAARQAFRFRAPWNEILRAARNDGELASRLAQAGLVTTAEDYRAEVEGHFARKAESQRRCLEVCFTVTTECGLACDYCFQKHSARQAAGLSTVDRVVSLIDRHLEKNAIVGRVELILFGGDPLLRPDLCRTLLARLGRVCASRDVEFVSLLTTNGIILDRAALAELEQAGLTRVQVSFDGPKAEHDTVRPGTFDTIIDSLRPLAERFRLSVKYNITKGNSSAEQYGRFLSSVRRALGNLPFLVVLEAIQTTTTSDASGDRYYATDSVELAETFIRLSQISRDAGVVHHLGAAFHPPCLMTAENAIMIQPDGNLCVCDTAYDLPDFTVGNVFTLNELPLDRAWVVEHIRRAAARTCVPRECCFWPICEGGCLYEKRRRKLDFDSPLCRQSYYERLVPYLFNLGVNKISHDS